MRCPKCGKELAAELSKCTYCGYTLLGKDPFHTLGDLGTGQSDASSPLERIEHDAEPQKRVKKGEAFSTLGDLTEENYHTANKGKHHKKIQKNEQDVLIRKTFFELGDLTEENKATTNQNTDKQAINKEFAEHGRIKGSDTGGPHRRKTSFKWGKWGFIAACIALIVLGSVFLLGKNDEEYVTREEWITMLAQNFGMTTYVEDTPYYSDIPSGHEAFSYIQSCREWGVLRDSKKFAPDKAATCEFVVETAVLAAVLEYDASLADMDTSALLQYAKKEGIMPSRSAKEKMTEAECTVLVDNIKRYCLSLELVNYEDIELRKDVVDLRTASGIQMENDVVYLPGNVASDIAVDSIIIVPGEQSDVAKKVTSVDNMNGQIAVQTTTPELEEVFEVLDFRYTGVPAIEDIKPSRQGVTVVPLTQVANASYCEDDVSAVRLGAAGPVNANAKKNALSFGIKIDMVEGALTPNIGFNNAIDIETKQNYDELFGEMKWEEAGELFKRTNTILKYDENDNLVLEQNEAWSGGWELTGEIAIENLYVEVSQKNNLESFSCELHFEANSSLTVKGEINGSVPIYETAIPLPWGIWVEVRFSVYVDFNGNATIGAQMVHTSRAICQDKKFKTVQDTEFIMNASLGGSVSSGISASVIPSVLGIELFDVSAKVGGSFEVEAVVHTSETDTMLCWHGEVHFPIVSLSIGIEEDTLANALNLTATFKIVDIAGAPFQSNSATLWHTEVTSAGVAHVKECSWGKTGVEESTTRPTTQNTSALIGQWNYYTSSYDEDVLWTIHFEENGQAFVGLGYALSEFLDVYNGQWSATVESDGTYIVELSISGGTTGEAEREYTLKLQATVDGKRLKMQHLTGDSEVTIFYDQWYERDLDYYDWVGRQDSEQASAFSGTWELSGLTSLKAQMEEYDENAEITISFVDSQVHITVGGQVLRYTDYELVNMHGYPCLVVQGVGCIIQINEDMIGVASLADTMDSYTLLINGTEYSAEYWSFMNVFMRQGNETHTIPSWIRYEYGENSQSGTGWEVEPTEAIYYPNANVVHLWDENALLGMFYVYESGNLEHIEILSVPWAQDLPGDTIYTDHGFVITDNR